MKFFQGLVLVMWRTAFAAVAKPVIHVMGRYDEYHSRKE